MYAPFSIHQAIRSGKKGAVIYTLKTLFYYRERKQRIMAFRKFIHSYIEPFCKPYSCNEKYDVIIYGSDQIWRKQPGLKYRFNPVYFAGNILMADKHVSYAASMGIIDLCSEDYTFLKREIKSFYKDLGKGEKLTGRNSTYRTRIPSGIWILLFCCPAVIGSSFYL